MKDARVGGLEGFPPRPYIAGGPEFPKKLSAVPTIYRLVMAKCVAVFFDEAGELAVRASELWNRWSGNPFFGEVYRRGRSGIE